MHKRCQECQQVQIHLTTCKRNGLCIQCDHNIVIGHSIHCVMASKEDVIKYAQQLSKEIDENRTRVSNWFKRLRDEVTMWQGKFHIVKQENNKLRKKLAQKAGTFVPISEVDIDKLTDNEYCVRYTNGMYQTYGLLELKKYKLESFCILLP